MHISKEKFLQNIYDTVKEWEIKIGYRPEAVQLYYPEESLTELLNVTEEELPRAISEFKEQVQASLGEIHICETKEKGRYCVQISEKGTVYIHENVPEPAFLKAFLSVITSPGKTLEDVEAVFGQFSEKFTINKTENREWSFWFPDGGPDPYVYHVEEDDFGLQYHRFTKEAYGKLFL